MFYPERHVQGLWNISSREDTEDTTVDLKKKSAVVPADVVPILDFTSIDEKRLFNGLSIEVESEWVMVGELEDCTDFTVEGIGTMKNYCRYCKDAPASYPTKPADYLQSIPCTNWKKVIVKDEKGKHILARSWHSWRYKDFRKMQHPTDEDPRGYLKRWGFPLREIFLITDEEPTKDYLYLRKYELEYGGIPDDVTDKSYNIQGIPHIQAVIDGQVVFLDNIRNALQYYSLQKKNSRLKNYTHDGGTFNEEDWVIANQLVKWEMLGRRVWFMNESVWRNNTLSQTAMVSVLSSIIKTVIQGNNTRDLYYYLLDTAIQPMAMARFLGDIKDPKDSSAIQRFDEMSTLEKHYAYKLWCPIKNKTVTPYEYIENFIKQFTGRDSAKCDEVMLSIEQICDITSRSLISAYRHLQARKVNHITLGRVKQTALRIASGGRKAHAYDSPSVKHSASVMGEYMDTTSKAYKSIVAKMRVKEEGKAIDDMAVFNRKYMSSGMAEWEWGTEGSKPTRGHGGVLQRWGKMIVIQPALTRDLKHKLKGRLYKPNEYGVVPAFMDRFATDKRVFKHKKNIKGGTVLIDASGSMSLSEDDVFEILETLPASTVAMYSGSSYKNKARGDADGELVILAKDQKQIAELPKALGENIIDYPALRWLSKQQTPRIWVSDEEVTQLIQYNDGDGTEAMATEEGKKECNDLVRQAKIIVLSDIKQVKEFGKSRRR